jgi:fatty acid-binding protein DegV
LEFVENIRERFSPFAIILAEFGPAIGAHVSPATVAITYQEVDD